MSSSATVSVRIICKSVIYSKAFCYYLFVVPQLSTVGDVYELEGRTAALNCTLSFPGSTVIPTLPITWYLLDRREYTDASLLDNAMFLPPQLASSLLLESVSINNAGTYVCALVEVNGEVEERIVEAMVDLFVFQSK